MGIFFMLDTATSATSSIGSILANRQRQHQMHGRTKTRTLARRPDSAAQGAEGVGAPVQADSVVGLAGFGRESLVEHALQVVRRNPNAVVLAMQVQLLAAGLGDDL